MQWYEFTTPTVQYSCPSLWSSKTQQTKHCSEVTPIKLRQAPRRCCSHRSRASGMSRNRGESNASESIRSHRMLPILHNCRYVRQTLGYSCQIRFRPKSTVENPREGHHVCQHLRTRPQSFQVARGTRHYQKWPEHNNRFGWFIFPAHSCAAEAPARSGSTP